MEIDVIKPFINHDVEVLVAGVWIEGHLVPIVKGTLILHPIGEAAAFYGPTALKADVIQAIRQVKKNGQAADQFIDPTTEAPKPVRSGLDPVTPGHRFGFKNGIDK